MFMFTEWLNCVNVDFGDGLISIVLIGCFIVFCIIALFEYFVHVSMNMRLLICILIVFLCNG